VTAPDLPEAPPANPRRWRPLLLVAGFALLAVAFALLLFGETLLGGGEEPILDQVPAFQLGTPVIAQIPAAGGAFNTIDVGQVAPDFSLPNLDGESVRLADFRGRPVIMNFWASWCAPCKLEMPELQAAYEAHQDEGLVILALNQDESAAIARDFFYEEMGLTFTPLLDDNSVVAASYGAFAVLPTTIFINGDGIVTATHLGPLTAENIAGYLEITPGGSG
jgi:peroxiredoxin